MTPPPTWTQTTMQPKCDVFLAQQRLTMFPKPGFRHSLHNSSRVIITY